MNKGTQFLFLLFVSLQIQIVTLKIISYKRQDSYFLITYSITSYNLKFFILMLP